MLGLNPLTLAAARQIIFAAETKAYQLASPSTVAVFDTGGQLIAHVRMDGVPPDLVDGSAGKALNALANMLVQKQRLQATCSGSSKLGLVYATNQENGGIAGGVSNLVDVSVVQSGGLAIHSEGRLIGAIGVSSTTPENDDVIALAALDAYASSRVTNRLAVTAFDPSSTGALSNGPATAGLQRNYRHAGE